jgi:hypothetical protein
MIVPLHYQIALSEDTVQKYGASDCQEAIDYMYGNLADGVKGVDTLPDLISHNTEYLYFRTDHHWTARGAYYAYVAFCREKGIAPTPLGDYQRLQFDGFLGTFYNNADLKQPVAMRDNPDYVEAFVPIGTNDEIAYDSNGKKTAEYSIVYKGADKYTAGNKYLCFIAGDLPLIKIHNESKNDGSSIVVIKESYGNAFVPFLVDSYEYVYVIDYRQWSNHLADFVVDNGTGSLADGEEAVLECDVVVAYVEHYLHHSTTGVVVSGYELVGRVVDVALLGAVEGVVLVDGVGLMLGELGLLGEVAYIGDEAQGRRLDDAVLLVGNGIGELAVGVR